MSSFTTLMDDLTATITSIHEAGGYRQTPGAETCSLILPEFGIDLLLRKLFPARDYVHLVKNFHAFMKILFAG